MTTVRQWRLGLVEAPGSSPSDRRGYEASMQELPDGYPLRPAGIDDYPVKVGSMLLTLVDPHRGYEVAYNRWYERDHYYAGCLVGPVAVRRVAMGRPACPQGPALVGRRGARSPSRRTPARTWRSTSWSRGITPTTSTSGVVRRCSTCTGRDVGSPSVRTSTPACSTSSA